MKNGMGNQNPDLASQVTLGSQTQHQIDFEHEGRRGTFVFRRPSLKDRLSISILESSLLGGAPRNSIDIQGQTIARMMATFSVVMVESPDFFNLDTFDDYAFTEALYMKYMEVIRPFRRTVGQGSQETGTAAGREDKVDDSKSVQCPTD